MTESEYVSAWDLNARQHLEDGDYEWLCDLKFVKRYETVMEIGCGSGCSTLTFLRKGFMVMAAEISSEAIATTRNLLDSEGWDISVIDSSENQVSFDGTDAALWNVDVISRFEAVEMVLDNLPIDLLVLCNPGGAMKETITKREADILLRHGFAEDEIAYNLQNHMPY